MKPKAYVSEEKKHKVKELEELFNKYKSFGIIDLTSLPSSTLQLLRHKFKKDGVLILTSKKSLIKIALTNKKDEIKNISDLIPILENTMPALIFTSMNSFKLASMINKNKSNAPAKPGQISPKDIIIPAGPTKFTPGPVIGELGAVGIKTIIQEGKIAIKDEITFIHKDEIIDKKKSEILTKLGIEPMEIGINLVAMYENDTIYLKDLLGITDEIYLNMIKESYQNSFNIAININYMAKETISTLIKKAYLQGKSLASKTNFDFSEEIKKYEQHELKLHEPELKETHEDEHNHETMEEQKSIHEDKDEGGAVGYTQEAVEKAQSILKELQDQKISENRT